MSGGAKRRPATRPAPRTVHVLVADGPFAGWEATARADFAAKILGDLQSGSIDRLIAALEAIIVEHNFPRPATAAELAADPEAGDQVAEHMADVDPYPGLLKVGGDLLDAIGKLPNR